MSDRRRQSTNKPPRARARDPRLDSLPPGTQETTLHAKPLRSGSEASQARVGQLEAEVARLKAALEADSDKLAQMLVRVSESERSRDAAEMRAREAVRARDDADQRVREAYARHAAALREATERLAAKSGVPGETSMPVDVHEAMAKIDSWLEELERGETMAQALRVWMIQQARKAARGASAARPAASDAMVLGDDEVEPID